jgi:hypothetical protein
MDKLFACFCYKHKNCLFFLCDGPAHFDLTYFARASSGLGFRALFLNILAISFHRLHFCIDICYSQFFSNSSITYKIHH